MWLTLWSFLSLASCPLSLLSTNHVVIFCGSTSHLFFFSSLLVFGGDEG